jgi:hypothetical protein
MSYDFVKDRQYASASIKGNSLDLGGKFFQQVPITNDFQSTDQIVFAVSSLVH